MSKQAAKTEETELSTIESRLLATCEKVIEKGLATVIETGLALMKIRDDRLYRRTHATFEKYADDKWGIARQRAYQLIDAAEVKEDLSTMVDKNPVSALLTNERQLRELSTVSDEDLPSVVDRIAEIVEETGKKPTAKVVKKARQDVLGKPETNGKAHEPASDGWPESEADSSIIKDDIDRDVPQKLREKHALKPAIITCGNKLNAIIREVEELGDKPGGEFIQTVHIKQLLKEAKGLIQDSAYYTECPDCKGKKCSRCEGGMGFIPKRMKNMLSDAEKGLLGI